MRRRGRGLVLVPLFLLVFFLLLVANAFRFLSFLGTLGPTAPFIGLFGTVLGIIGAFNNLAFNPQGGIGVVMSQLSEALVATAAGLLVAIPAVIAYNVFMRMVQRRLSGAQTLVGLYLSWLQGRGNGD